MDNHPTNLAPHFHLHDVEVVYPGAKQPSLKQVSASFTPGAFTAIVGPNACGKSTLLKTMARLLKPSAGRVELGGKDVASLKPKALARQVALLPQSPTAPEGIVVEDLVARGRYPHQGIFKQWTSADAQAVERALEITNTLELKDRPAAELSGGQRQRVWLALALAQDTPIVLLDEPTTYLDITHQVEVLRLARQLVAAGRTVIAVLHELSLAFRYADEVLVMQQGRKVAHGKVADVITAPLISDVYDLPVNLLVDPESQTPVVVPR